MKGHHLQIRCKHPEAHEGQHAVTVCPGSHLEVLLDGKPLRLAQDVSVSVSKHQITTATMTLLLGGYDVDVHAVVETFEAAN